MSEELRRRLDGHKHKLRKLIDENSSMQTVTDVLADLQKVLAEQRQDDADASAPRRR